MGVGGIGTGDGTGVVGVQIYPTGQLTGCGAIGVHVQPEGQATACACADTILTPIIASEKIANGMMNKNNDFFMIIVVNNKVKLVTINKSHKIIDLFVI